MELKGKLSTVIFKIVSNTYSRSDLSTMVHVSISLAEAYLRIQLYYKKLQLKITAGDEIHNIAIDIIGPLFTRNNDGEFTAFQRYFKPLVEDIEDQDDLALIHLRRIVYSMAKQEIINLFKLEDPAGWRIYRNIQLAPKRNKNIGVFTDMDIQHYYYSPGVPIESVPSGLKPDRPEIPGREVEVQVLDLLKISQKTPVIVELLLKSLVKNDEYRFFLSREILFRSLKSVWGIKLVPFNDDLLSTGMNEYNEKKLLDNHNAIIKNLSLHIQEVIYNTYVNSRKISFQDAEHYIKILNEYFSDLLSTGSTQTLPQYLEYHSNGELEMDQWDLHRSRMEYMIKIGKNHLRDLWEK